MIVIVYKRDDGGVSCISPVGDDLDAIEQIIPELPGGGRRPRFRIDSSELPDRQFRNAWILDEQTGQVGHDLAKARQVVEWRNRKKINLRTARLNQKIAEEKSPVRRAELESKRDALRAEKEADLSGLGLSILRDYTIPGLDDSDVVDPTDADYDALVDRAVPRNAWDYVVDDEDILR